MDNSPPPKQRSISIIHPRPEHFEKIQDLCRKVYPFSKPWSLDQLESHHSYFPDGQLIAIDEESGALVGMAFSLIIAWNDYLSQDSWKDFTASGWFHNHNPRHGKTLYGAEVMVDPEARGQGIGKLLYQGRKEIVEKYSLKRIRAGARLRGYSKYQDKYSPEDYVKAVVEKKIFDPTLSFQLNQGFKVIDVSKNYLFNDPESLGYAAVIEWLNPKAITAKDSEIQARSISSFMRGEKFVSEHLPVELRRLVRRATVALGNVIQECESDGFYARVDHYRQQLKKLRKENDHKQLQSLLAELRREPKSRRQRLAHAFSLQLEMVNLCEAAYRTWRQRLKPVAQGLKSKVGLTFTLTAHPAEARPRAAVEELSALGNVLVEGLQSDFQFNENEMLSRLRLLWLHPLAKLERMSAVDEAEYIYSLIFSEPLFDFILTEKPSYEIDLRTWVGGDKGSLPLANKDSMRECLEKSRGHIKAILIKKLDKVIHDAVKLVSVNRLPVSQITPLVKLVADLSKLKPISTGDGNRIKSWALKYRRFLRETDPYIAEHHQIILINRILDAFPALVFPIELREDAPLIQAALKDPHSPIRGMLTDLAKFSGALKVNSYAKCLVVAQVESAADIGNAGKLIFLSCRVKSLPVVPLFESKEALAGAKKTVKSWLELPGNRDLVVRHWDNTFEVMLGYADSAKKMGVLPSRLAISKCMADVEKVVRQFQLRPAFFHGAGGTVARGGGNLREQMGWWSADALKKPNFTIQGEMVRRMFATKEILNSQCVQMAAEALRRRPKKVKAEKFPALDSFVARVNASFENAVNDKELLPLLTEASPYRYLEALRIKSRTAKRGGPELSADALRAVPWVLSCTQTRLLLPVWWGIGSAWKDSSPAERELLKGAYEKSPFLSSFVKTLGFSLAKVDLDIWRLYLPADSANVFAKFEEEFALTENFFEELTQQKNLIWHRPWLEEAIRLRAPNIHILNLLQIIALETDDEPLLRETIVGIASGMLTTG
ncbi:MAG: phosphoenolpyruvate carboxylase [Proteobacteria bacterium]|nr:MAG: phosphoenolpyruvate carboxylase [Pseudomonadota bacterium]